MSEPRSGVEIEVNLIRTRICIVGGGPVGLALSIGLTEAGVPHMIVESGGVDIGDAQVLTEGENIGMYYVDPSIMRVRALGGTLHVWGGHSNPLRPIDFEKRDWIPNSGWPITYREFIRWIAPAARTLHLENWWTADEFDPAYRETVEPERGFFDLSTYKLSPVHGDGLDVHKGNFWQFNRDRVGADIVLDTTVRRLNFRDNGTVASIDCTRADDRPLRIEADRFVLACGGIETARFLLINRRHGGPLVALDAIGRYFMEHPHPYIGRLWYATVPPPKFFGFRARDGSVSFWRFFLNEEAQRRHRIGSFAPMLTLVGSSRREGEGEKHLVSIVSALSEQMPDERSRVLISDDKTDALGDPLTLVDYFVGADDQRTAWTGASLFAREVGLQGFGRLQLELPPPAEGATRSIFMGGGHHHMGTVRMGTDKATAVVDSNLTVFGAPNLSIASTGVFPTSGTVNPTMNAIALAFRLADHLARSENR